jgi:hypothetical protein
MSRPWLGICTSLLMLAFLGGASAQTRMTDKDVENTMKSLQDDTKKFRSSFDSAVGKSTIRNTDQEKHAKNLVEGFQKQTEEALKQFQKDKTADPSLTNLRSNATQIDQVLTTASMGPDVAAQWSKVKTELGSLAGAFGMGEPAAPTTPK